MRDYNSHSLFSCNEPCLSRVREISAIFKKYIARLQVFINAYKKRIWLLKKQPPELFYKDVLKSFAKFIGKNLCQSLLWHRWFPVNFVNFLRTPILKKTCERLLLLLILARSWVFMTYQRRLDDGRSIKTDDGIILMILWEKSLDKVLWCFDQFSRSHEVAMFWIRREWRHTRKCSKYFIPSFLCIFLLIFWKKVTYHILYFPI